MSRLDSALREQMRRTAAIATRSAVRSVRQLKEEVESLKLAVREQRRILARLELRLAQLRRVGVRAGRTGGPHLSSQSIRATRSRLEMTREQFAKLVGVSPGSIFGWETGRTTPRGASMKRLVELQRLSPRGARAHPPDKPRRPRPIGRKR